MVLVCAPAQSLAQAVDRVLLLRDGAVEAFGPRAEVLRRLAAPAARPATVVAAPAPDAAAA